jgi:cell wall-associated NlpC family hydrolase
LSYRSRRGRLPGVGFVVSAVLAGVLAHGVTDQHGGARGAAGAAAAGTYASVTGGRTAAETRRAAAATAISYARKQLGKPYVWGGPTQPGTGYGFDCSGLVMMAWRSAGVHIQRRSQDQWATLRHVQASRVQPGDLVFFAGADGTMTDPGHVGLVTGHGQMIEAYATGFPVRVASYDRKGLVGFADPDPRGPPGGAS